MQRLEREGEASRGYPPEPGRALARRPPEASIVASGGRLGSAEASPSRPATHRRAVKKRYSEHAV
jgi:hypothetical protein